MIRERMMGAKTVERNGFRWRGREVSRLEALSDAVFGFAITLLVVSLEVPRTTADLLEALRGFPAFAASFALLFLVWYNHYRFFRRYGLEDTWTVVLNAVLLFVIVFFVYPLKFVFGYVVTGLLFGGPRTVALPDGTQVPIMDQAHAPWMMLAFSGGYVGVFLVFALLHLHALRLRDELELNELERFDTVDNVRESLLNVGIGVVSIILAFSGGPGPQLAGFVYWLVGPVAGLNGWLNGKARERLKARLQAGSDAPAPADAAAQPAASGAG